MIVIAEISPVDQVAGVRKLLRLTTHDSVAGTGVNSQDWSPAIVEPPIVGIRLFKGDFDGKAAATGGSLKIALEQLEKDDPAVWSYFWPGAPIKLWAGVAGQAWPWQQVFDGGVVSSTAEGNILSIQTKVNDEPFEVDALISKYAGTGGIEGGEDLKETPKPLLFGRCFNAAPVLIDAVNNVYQVHGYGPIEAVTKLYERGSDFDADIAAFAGDFANYATLVAATIAPGRWGTCLAQGLVRLGAPQAGVITADVDGDKGGAIWRNTAGAVILRLCEIAGISGTLIESASFTAIDTALLALPFNGMMGWYQTQQTSVLSLASQLTSDVNHVCGVSLLGKLFASPLTIGTPTITLDAQGRQDPTVYGSKEESVSPPFSLIEMGYARSWRVHTEDEITNYDVDPATQAALDILAAATGKVTFGGPLPSAASSSVGDLHVGDDGTFYERVSSTGILLGGKVVVLAGFRPSLPWTLSPTQPLRDAIITANEAYASANDAIDRLIGLADDGIISINEKITKLIPEQARLDEKYTVLAGQATGLAVSTAAAAVAKATWDAMLAGLSPAWNNITADSPVVRATFDAARNGFDTALYDLDAAIKAKAATIANWSGIANDNGNRPDDNATRNRMRGNYSGIATYAPGDTVLWLVADGGTGTGFTRIASGDTSGVNPADATKWMPFAEEGQDGSLMIRETLPAFDTVKVGQKVMLADGLIYRRVGSGGILLDGKVIVLAGYRPVLPWTLESTQPVAAGIRYGLQAIDEAQAASDAALIAQTLANDAQATADGKIQTYYQATAPSGASEGDIWIDTDDGNNQYRRTSGAWVDVQDTGIGQAIADAAGAQATADGKVTTFIGETAPTADAIGDLWLKASSGQLRRWSGTSWGDPLADLTAVQQVVIVPPVPQIVYRDWQGNIKSGQYNRTLVPKVERGGIDIRDDDDVTYSISTTGSIAATVNNTTASADKGKITATDGSSGSIVLTVTVAGVSFPTFTIPFTNQDDNPPTTGGGSGNTGGSDSTLEDVTSTSFATITQQDGGESVFLIDITSGQTLNGTAPLTYQKSGSNTTATALTGKWQYRLQGDPTWLDFTGSAITGTGAYWNDVDFIAESGDATINQSKASLATGTYEVQLVAAKSNSAAGNLQIISGTATVSRT